MDDLAMIIAQRITDRWMVGKTSQFCDDQPDWDDAEIEDVAAVIREVLDAASDDAEPEPSPRPIDPVYGNYRNNGRWFFRSEGVLHGPFLSEDAARTALALVETDCRIIVVAPKAEG